MPVEPAHPVVRPGWGPEKPLSGVTLLLVEDSRFASEAMRLLCLRSGARIRRADTLAAAWRHLRSYRPNGVVVDLGLPDGRGETLIADLAKAQPRIWMILATSGDDGAEDRAMAAGADGFLGKPLVNLSVFQATVLSLLPARPAPAAISAPPGDKVRPDPFAYCDDMKHAASILAGLSGPDDLAYVTQFLGGVARTAKDLPLEKAVSGLARVPRSRAKNSAALLQLTCMVDARIAASGPV